jgi:1-acyl-sn-glycerol-3-phosphate acyltransferase
MTVVYYVRGVLFTIVLYVFTLFWTSLCLPMFLFPVRKRRFVPVVWSYSVRFLLRVFCGIQIQVKGLENLPKQGGYIIASKHQSALETTAFHSMLPQVIYVLKRELSWIPVVGWWFRGTNCIVINRSEGTKAMLKMFEQASERLAEKYRLIIFPEGTRVPVGQHVPYHPGIYLLYEKTGATVVPVALNTGYCWPKNKTIKYTGRVTFEFLPPMPKGLNKKEFMSLLEERIETACARLPLPAEAKKEDIKTGKKEANTEANAEVKN